MNTTKAQSKPSSMNMETKRFGNFNNNGTGKSYLAPLVGDKEIRVKKSTGPNQGKEYEVEWDGKMWKWTRWIEEPEKDAYTIIKEMHTMLTRQTMLLNVIGNMLEEMKSPQKGKRSQQKQG